MIYLYPATIETASHILPRKQESQLRGLAIDDRAQRPHLKDNIYQLNLVYESFTQTAMMPTHYV